MQRKGCKSHFSHLTLVIAQKSQRARKRETCPIWAVNISESSQDHQKMTKDYDLMRNPIYAAAAASPGYNILACARLPRVVRSVDILDLAQVCSPFTGQRCRIRIIFKRASSISCVVLHLFIANDRSTLAHRQDPPSSSFAIPIYQSSTFSTSKLIEGFLTYKLSPPDS